MTKFLTQDGVLTGNYPFPEIDLISPLRASMTVQGVCFLDPAVAGDSQALRLLAEHLFEVRSAAMEEMHGTDFQQALLQLAEHCRQQHFEGPTLFQKTPSLRIHLPGALGTSWHSDSWYGHHSTTRTFWASLTPVAAGAGVSYINTEGFTQRLNQRLQAGTIGLHDINRICSAEGQETLCEPGQYLTFNGNTLHGSVGNTSARLRCSIDFRAAVSAAHLGSKPLSNYRLVDAGMSRDATRNYGGMKAVKYVCGAGGQSTKYQHVLLEAYGHDNNIQIVRNEAEIEALDALPVLTAYANRQVPGANDYAALLMPSIAGLPADPARCQALLRTCRQQNISLHFVLEDKVFPDTVSEPECLSQKAGLRQINARTAQTT